MTRCAKYGCAEPAKHVIETLPSVFVFVCREHLDWGKNTSEQIRGGFRE